MPATLGNLWSAFLAFPASPVVFVIVAMLAIAGLIYLLAAWMMDCVIPALIEARGRREKRQEPVRLPPELRGGE